MNTNEPVGTKSSRQSVCTTGSCGGSGMCPGNALLISYGLWALLAAISGLVWLAWTLAVPVFLLLVTGYWRLLSIFLNPAEISRDD